VLFYFSLSTDFKVVQEQAAVATVGEYEFEVVEEIALKAWAFHVPADTCFYRAELDASDLILFHGADLIPAVVFVSLRPYQDLYVTNVVERLERESQCR